LRGVVGRLAVVRGGDDDDGALLGERIGVLVERFDRGGEPTAPRVVGDAVRDAFSRAEIGAEQHQERRRMRVCSRRRGGGGRGGARGGGGRSRRLLGRREKPCRRVPRAALHVNDEIRRLDRQCLFGLELIVGEVDKLEALQQHG